MITKRSVLAGIALALVPAAAYAHERFIKHTLKVPLHNDYFLRHKGMFLGIESNMLQIATLVFLVLAASLTVWFFRERLDLAIEHGRIGRLLRRKPEGAVRHLATFLMDKDVKLAWFDRLGEWALILFMRSPALLLMYAATNDSLLMPSFPLEPSSAAFFKFAQVLIAILMLTQTLLPLVGALVLGTLIYLNIGWGWIVVVDALPFLAVAAVYVTWPWRSHDPKFRMVDSERHQRWLRRLLGLSFFVLGWMKLYNHDLTAGVADNYPSVMADPMIGFFSMGTDMALQRENWVVAFGLAEVLTGFMLTVGVFTRLWCVIMISVFAKLTLVDFGWNEIPHIYPISAMMAIAFSSKITTDFQFVERFVRKIWREEKGILHVAAVVGMAAAIAAAVIFPILWGLTFTDRSGL